ncbi:hypothetical protein GGTG_10724 [Gaeumannomyces tritici R3-111a-1]|uniref:protein-ribulosamine 3-kinase n=1 Tax=Gaeumannomyces tritici (strain R3-111a-1) TaxID=644352 RepID=J3PB51_GAET3|nr:hypothetical protein GGTG_10724 [Gaeumannomyces tritici R3-111a-1]EJT71467.1 hypothetical protein GGTG_10724 [Gaeumannomyces tritici R3-111a-1]
MAPNGVDPAILEALKLDPGTAKMTTHGGSGFASTFKLAGTATGGDGKQEQRAFFIKTGSGADAQVMFRGEHASLNAIHDAVPGFCPRSHAYGAMAGSPGKFFLATDFLDLSGSGGGADGTSLAAKLAELHTTPAPQAAAEDGTPQQAMFGFTVPTCCGSTAQENGWRGSWADFYADNRLRAIARAGTRANGADAELERAVEATAARVVPRLLGDGHLRGVVPVVCHGDLWSGNHGVGRIVGGPGHGRPEEVVFDPSSVYGHSEYDLGIMRMFGGFGAAFWKDYGELVPKSEPVEEFEDRVALYELYHHLNHFAIFGGGYRGGAMSIMKRLLSKYS